MSDYWGYELTLDCKSCDIDKIKDAEYIKKFVKTLVNDIDMVAYGDCQVVDFGEDPKVSGFSVVQLIETSLISAHLVNQNGDAYWNIFSCRDYDIEKVISLTKEWFSPKRVRYAFNTRQA